MIKLFYVDRNDTYKEWELLPNKLLIVEDIETYLATKQCLTLNDFQYIKNELEIGINVDITQAYSQPKATTSFKYVAIQNTGENIHYYFVKKAVWRSKSCVRFELVMDVLNTFKEGHDYEFKANTRITREHKSRFYAIEDRRTIDLLLTGFTLIGTLEELDNVKLYTEQGAEVFTGIIEEINIDSEYVIVRITSSETDEEIYTTISNALADYFELQNADSPANYMRFYLEAESDYRITHHSEKWNKIDYVSENINPILIRKYAPKTIEKTGLLKQNWYLLYRNVNDPDPNEYVNPVECYLIPENSTPINKGVVSSGRITGDTLNANTYYYIRIPAGVSTTLSNGTNYPEPSQPPYVNVLVVTKQSNGLLSISAANRGTSPYTLYYRESFDDIEYISFSAFPIPYYPSTTPLAADNYAQNIYGNETDSFSTDYEGDYIDGIDLLDKTDAKNIKLIKLPYCPYTFTEASGKIRINDTAWVYSTITQYNGVPFSALQLNNLNTKLDTNIAANNANPFDLLRHTDFTPNITQLRSIDDPKLLHSEFYSPSFVYDSFTLKIELEKCSLDWYTATNTNNVIKFTMTSTINSKFMFTFTSYANDKSESNFYNVLPVARNNEIVLYNVPYINYVRTGYQYDVKNKNISNISNAIGLGLSGATMLTSLALPSVPLKVAGVIASLASMAMSIKSTVVSAIQNENSIKQKLDQYKNQAASVAGSDDVDLMSEYCGNRLLYMVYEPTTEMKNLINDLFFYAGYASTKMGIPTHHNRYNFDYLECDASIEKTSAMPEECLSELVGAFKNGVTYLHKTTRDVDKWDFAQKYENWEIELLED